MPAVPLTGPVRVSMMLHRYFRLSVLPTAGIGIVKIVTRKPGVGYLEWAPTITAHIALERFRRSGRTVDARVALSAGIEVLMRPWSTDLTGARFSLCLQWAGMLWTARK